MPVRGGGSARATTTHMSDAFATIAFSPRASGASSRLRRSTVERSSTRTMRARAPGAPDRSPARRTLSPMMTPPRLISLARTPTTRPAPPARGPRSSGASTTW